MISHDKKNSSKRHPCLISVNQSDPDVLSNAFPQIPCMIQCQQTKARLQAFDEAVKVPNGATCTEQQLQNRAPCVKQQLQWNRLTCTKLLKNRTSCMPATAVSFALRLMGNPIFWLRRTSQSLIIANNTSQPVHYVAQRYTLRQY